MPTTVNPTAAAAPERLSGEIRRVVMHSPTNGFAVLQVKVPGQREAVAVTGVIHAAAAGSHIEASGHWTEHAKHGRQFQASEIRAANPSSADGVRRFLSSGVIKGLGPKLAERLVNTYGERLPSLIENHPLALEGVRGISKRLAQSIHTGWRNYAAKHDIKAETFLCSLGVGPVAARKIQSKHGTHTIQRITENPYRLIEEVDGVGFVSADAMASHLGVQRDSPLRVAAGVMETMSRFAERGDCAVPKERLLRSSAKLLGGLDDALVDGTIDQLVHGRTLVHEAHLAAGSVLYLPYLHRAETEVARHLARLMQPGLPTPWPSIALDRAIPWVEGKLGIQLAESQKGALRTLLSHKVSILTGGPGCGKSTLINSLITILEAKGVRVSLAAPTGRAAKRMTETTGKPSSTLHRLLEYDARRRTFTFGEDNPLDVDVLIVDEISMQEIVMAKNNLAALPDRAAIIFVGDADQLPSVGPGMFLADMLRSGVIPTARLTEVFRQAATSQIIVQAHAINRGQLPVDTDGDFRLVLCDEPTDIERTLREQVFGAFAGYDPLRDIQVLTPMHKGRLGTQALNAALQSGLNPNPRSHLELGAARYGVGDRVLQTRNNYDLEVFNGDIGMVAHADPRSRTLDVMFDGRRVRYGAKQLGQLTLAYACSVHKSQGSQFPVVLMPLVMEHAILLERSLFYTAVTRGAKHVVVVAQKRALEMAVRRNDSARRMTGLTERLRNP